MVRTSGAFHGSMSIAPSETNFEGFAPAVLVAPLGTVALISNILIAPMFLGERMRKRDIYGIMTAILGISVLPTNNRYVQVLLIIDRYY